MLACDPDKRSVQRVSVARVNDGIGPEDPQEGESFNDRTNATDQRPNDDEFSQLSDINDALLESDSNHEPEPSAPFESHEGSAHDYEPLPLIDSDSESLHHSDPPSPVQTNTRHKIQPSQMDGAADKDLNYEDSGDEEAPVVSKYFAKKKKKTTKVTVAHIDDDSRAKTTTDDKLRDCKGVKNTTKMATALSLLRVMYPKQIVLPAKVFAKLFKFKADTTDSINDVAGKFRRFATITSLNEKFPGFNDKALRDGIQAEID